MKTLRPPSATAHFPPPLVPEAEPAAAPGGAAAAKSSVVIVTDAGEERMFAFLDDESSAQHTLLPNPGIIAATARGVAASNPTAVSSLAHTERLDGGAASALSETPLPGEFGGRR